MVIIFLFTVYAALVWPFICIYGGYKCANCLTPLLTDFNTFLFTVYAIFVTNIHLDSTKAFMKKNICISTNCR